MKIEVKTFFLVLGLFLFSCSSSEEYTMKLEVKDFPSRTQDFSLWQLEPFFHEVQMGYILKTDDNKIIIVDGGGVVAAPYLESYIKQLGGTVHEWIITHAHMDHMGAFLEIADRKEIKIDMLVHVPPTKEWVLENEPISMDNFQSYITTIQKANVTVDVPHFNKEYTLGEGVTMKVLSAGNFEITENAINNSSLVFKISSKSKSILFLGDMGIRGGETILLNSKAEDLKADYVQMAHHGQSGVEKDFYNAVQANYALWPTPEWLWENRADGKGNNTGSFKTLLVREWMQELGISKSYVSGLEGTVQID